MPSNDELSQGARANAAGRAYEEILAPLFQQYGYEVLKWSTWRDRGLPLEESGKVAIKQFPYTTIYDRPGHTEWLLVNNDRGLVLRLEVKSQRKKGSVDEKLPYTYLNSLAYPENKVILLVDGAGFREGSIPWLKRMVEERWLQDEYGYKDIQVLNLSEFIAVFIAELS